jgi:hypothetical protein
MVIPGANINAAIYSGSTSFTVDGVAGKLYDDNQWYSQLFVDVINGFSLGQWGGNWGNAVDTVAQTGWYQKAPYAGAWNPPSYPSGVTAVYNPWGAIIARYGDAFQSPFSQSPALPPSMQPQLTIGPPTATLQVTIPPDHIASTVSASAAVARFSGAGATQTVTLRNTGRTLATLGRAALGGHDRRHFAIAKDRCSRKRLMPGDRCRVTVRFRPRSAGRHSARLVVPHDARGGKRVVRLRGRA